ncbi:OprD family porin [Pseudomonas edaphica]|uniref:OprD family porin n=1 Tax=Pseudomonas edaphica TaxID=2006980 RepID=A0A5R8R5I9_9PSED|nr:MULTISPECIES: OprD family porin [Pseudomonas]MCF5139603.1 outer membrane porin, OprD family [Pseudomonas sp. PA-6-3C]MCF5145953.1 outer membrane porin, OprD family [Pseudomonas sp. PA-6-3F]MCF5161198.1 outer membrane porin, OprD family [Pseudomonas sp. PA-6-2E]MCF5176353.1 outer membrane porin, OprD family [Pseudomonas sp. PA-6-1D]MCF5194515.1 outer membrane porin, OprD family [Pseudomonas sp. PA-6-1H]
MKLSSKALLALAISSITATAFAETQSQDFVPTTLAGTSAQSEAKGFVDGASLGGTTRNWFSNEQKFRGGKFTYQKHGEARTDAYRTNWVQGTILNLSSGFTQGTVGVATEVAAYNALVLDRSKRDIKGGSNRTLADSNGDAVDQWSKLGLANVKFRVSNTTLTAGRQNFSSGIVDTIGNRALPSSFEGFALNSEEFSNLSFQGAYFDRVSPRTEQSLSKFRSEYGNGQEADHVYTAGVNYQPFKSLKTSFFGAQVKDFWNQYYFGATHELGDAQTLALTTGLNYYKTVDEGKKLMGKIDNDTYSLSLGLTHQAHSLTFSYQEVNGNEYFDYLHETNGIYLANSLTSDFNGPNEKSFQVAYGLNMAEYGVPGLKFNIYSARGWGIDGTHYTGDGGVKGFAYNGIQNQDGEKHQEYGIGTSYALQSGPLKATTIRGTYVTHRASANQADGNIREFRLVTTIPFNIL